MLPTRSTCDGALIPNVRMSLNAIRPQRERYRIWFRLSGATVGEIYASGESLSRHLPAKLMLGVDMQATTGRCFVEWSSYGRRNVQMTPRRRTGCKRTRRNVKSANRQSRKTAVASECKWLTPADLSHMTCKKCKWEFCWVCMGPWSEHGNSWYQCNRFEEKSGIDARDTQAKSRASLERYLHVSSVFLVVATLAHDSTSTDGQTMNSLRNSMLTLTRTPRRRWRRCRIAETCPGLRCNSPRQPWRR